MRDRVQMLFRMKKMKILILHTSPLQNHYFWVPMEVKMEPQYRLETTFIAIENDNRKAMLFGEVLETFLLPKPGAEERCLPPGTWSWTTPFIYRYYTHIYIFMYIYIYGSRTNEIKA